MALRNLCCEVTFLSCLIVFLSPPVLEGARSRGRIDESHLPYEKSGRCPAVEVVNRLTNRVCDQNLCDTDSDCEGPKKCCYNNCGGRSCVFPLDTVRLDVPRDHIVVSEVDSQSKLLTVNEGETAVLYCNASSRIPTSYGWILVQPAQDFPTIDVFPPGSTIGNKRVSSDGRRLIVLGARVQDTANYACVAASLLGYVTKSYQLYVNATMPPPGATQTEVVPDSVVADSQAAESTGDSEAQSENWQQLMASYLPDVSQRITTTMSPIQQQVPTTSAPPIVDAETAIAGPLTNPVCYQPRNKGTCSREEDRWYFNSLKGKCEPFTYSGCNGNLNNFYSYEECNRTCPYTSQPACEQPIFTGPCRARFIRWAYDSERGECVNFVYGGCRMNGNNFHTRDECTAQCVLRRQGSQLASPPVEMNPRLAECRCVRQRLKNCFCDSEFAIEGTVLQKHNSLNGDILVIEVQNVFKQGALSLRETRTLSNNVTIIRDMSQRGRNCQCHTLEPNSVPYIIMGYMNTQGDAEIDANSYVSEATRRRANKLEEKMLRAKYCRPASRGASAISERTGRRGRARFDA
ncbi:WAP, Kazal, immunoglobulin, Kunitz and NTR domain-containing protein 1-like [Diadema setosum]|uniref:WAP, Kazal, immunoglobulin, Kunitz and NTR domain-containing protein 1-like n=1 Tax=Diadema setosum TaxID=31175 RepID=UPI003B3B8DB8